MLPTTVRPHRQPNTRPPERPKWINEGTLRRQHHDSWPHVRAGSLPCNACPRPLIRRHTPNHTVADAQAPPHHIQKCMRSRSEESQQQPSRDCRTGKTQIQHSAKIFSRMHIIYRPVPGRPLKPSEHTLPPIGGDEISPPSHAWGYQTSRSPHAVRPRIFSRGLAFSSRMSIFEYHVTSSQHLYIFSESFTCPPVLVQKLSHMSGN